MPNEWGKGIDGYLTSLRDTETRSLGVAVTGDLWVDGLTEAVSTCREVVLIGNGGSLAIASHIAKDFVGSGVPASSPDNAVALSADANDFGYEQIFDRVVLSRSPPKTKWEDGRKPLLVAMSCSGASVNVLLAAQTAHDLGWTVVTMSGFSEENSLRSIGCHFDLYVPSYWYGPVQVAHLLALHLVSDRLAAMNRLSEKR